MDDYNRIHHRETIQENESIKKAEKNMESAEINTNDYIIRLERTEDCREVENLVRESFWNVYRSGCSEHYVIHVLRDDPAFVKDLDFVMSFNGGPIFSTEAQTI